MISSTFSLSLALVSVLVILTWSDRTLTPTAEHIRSAGEVSTLSRSFSWFRSGPAPKGWPHLSLPGHAGVLSYPPWLHPIDGDPGTVSAASRDAQGRFLAYVNATPRQGDESLVGWDRFRIGILRGDAARSATEIAAATMLPFRGGPGSCVIDDYVTRVRGHHFREIACFVRGADASSVVVAATPIDLWSRNGPWLEQVIAAYEVD